MLAPANNTSAPRSRAVHLFAEPLQAVPAQPLEIHPLLPIAASLAVKPARVPLVRPANETGVHLARREFARLHNGGRHILLSPLWNSQSRSDWRLFAKMSCKAHPKYTCFSRPGYGSSGADPKMRHILSHVPSVLRRRFAQIRLLLPHGTQLASSSLVPADRIRGVRDRVASVRVITVA